jgi:hypothetical protein
MPSQPQFATSDKIWGIDKRFIIAAVIFVILVVPVFPQEKVVMVDGQTTTTQVTEIASFTTVTQSAQSGAANSIQVYVGYVKVVPDTYYGYFTNFYRGCFWRFRRIYCGWRFWPNYNDYLNTVTISASDQIVSISESQAPNGLETVALTSYSGNVRTIQNVIDASNLSQTGTATVTGTTMVVNTVVNSVFSPTAVAFPVDCKACVAKTVTVRVSILQMIFGLT